MIETSKDGTISLYEWLITFNAFTKDSDEDNEEAEDESNELADVQASKEIKNLKQTVLSIVQKHTKFE